MREPSWLHDDVYHVLQQHRAALCIHDLLDDHPFAMTTDWTYIRFHRPDATRHPYRGAYGPDRLQPWADRLTSCLGDGRDVYCYFNNDYGGLAVPDAQWLRHAIDPASRCE